MTRLSKTQLARSVDSSLHSGQKNPNFGKFIRGKGKMISVRELVGLLIKQEMGDEIIIRDKNGKQLHNVSICTREGQGIGCLFT